jgi:hypothetical protein
MLSITGGAVRRRRSIHDLVQAVRLIDEHISGSGELDRHAVESG